MAKKTFPRLRRHRWALLGGLLGAAVFLLLYGVRVLDPTEVDWILNNASPDPAQHYLGWAFFRNSPVRLPYLGANYNVVYPFRTSVLFTDSIPIFALFFKIFAAFLPQKFQYFGIWGLFCFVFQGALGQRVIAKAARAGEQDTPRQLAALLGAGLLILYPALNIRLFAHSALAANWLILLAFYLYFNADTLFLTARRACLAWGLLGLLCGGIHLYYLPMCGLVLVGFAVRSTLKKRGAAYSFLPILCFCATAVAEVVILGAFASNFAGYANGYLSGADLANLLIPGLNASWEQDVYAGLGTVLALLLATAGLVRYTLENGVRSFKKWCTAHRGWLVSGAVLLLLDGIAAAGNAVVFAGQPLFTLPLPAALMGVWTMFSSCARLAWVAGLLLAVLSSGAVLRLWGTKIGAVMLVICVAAQGLGQAEHLGERFERYHTASTYADATLLTDPAWATLAADPRFAHLAYASFDFEQPAFWDLTAYAADNGWTSNSFYMAHMDGNLAAETLPGELNDLSADTLYVFLQEDELARDAYALHYYRINDILIGCVEPLDLPEDARPTALTCPMDLSTADCNDAATYTAADGITLTAGGELLSKGWTIFPGVYEVTLTGSGFDHSYIYARYGLINESTFENEIVFTTVDAEKMTFRFTAPAMQHYWRTAVHALDDTPVVVSGITVEKVG